MLAKGGGDCNALARRPFRRRAIGLARAAFVCLFACFTATNLYVRAGESHRAR